jgi:hypothetical protein
LKTLDSPELDEEPSRLADIDNKEKEAQLQKELAVSYVQNQNLLQTIKNL